MECIKYFFYEIKQGKYWVSMTILNYWLFYNQTLHKKKADQMLFIFLDFLLRKISFASCIEKIKRPKLVTVPHILFKRVRAINDWFDSERILIGAYIESGNINTNTTSLWWITIFILILKLLALSNWFGNREASFLVISHFSQNLV